MTSVPPSSPLEPGLWLDRYQLICPIAQGGMAAVWVARLTGKHGFEKLVAIKTIRAEHASDPEFVKMFLDEARLVAQIRHPNVAEIMDLGEQHDVLYLVLEWIDGDSLSTLRRILKKHDMRMPLGIAMRICADACSGLHAAHELEGADGKLLGVVHRDVSPPNILVSKTGGVKVIDFGVAKALDRLSEETATGVIKGKVNYMAPEQALGKPVDRRADIWAIGVVLYQLLSNRVPYQGENQLSTLHRLTSGGPAEPLPEAPPAVADVIRTALSPDRDRRYKTAVELQKALERVMVETSGPTTSAEVAAFVDRHLTERIEERRSRIDRALRAVADRERITAELAAAVDEPSSTGQSRRRKPPLPRPPMQSGDVYGVESEERIEIIPAGGVSPGADAADPLALGDDDLVPLADETSHTLGSTSVEKSTGAVAARDRRRRTIALAAGAAGAVVVLGVAAVLAGGDDEAVDAPAASPPVASEPPETGERTREPKPPDEREGVAEEKREPVLDAAPPAESAEPPSPALRPVKRTARPTNAPQKPKPKPKPKEDMTDVFGSRR